LESVVCFLTKKISRFWDMYVLLGTSFIIYRHGEKLIICLAHRKVSLFFCKKECERFSFSSDVLIRTFVFLYLFGKDIYVLIAIPSSCSAALARSSSTVLIVDFFDYPVYANFLVQYIALFVLEC
jgi:hypothetical protein